MLDVSVLDKTICIQLVVTEWSGRRRLRKEDLGDAADSMPPEELSSLGALKLCDPKIIRQLTNIKRAAETDLRRVCVRFLGGYATDEGNLPALSAKLTAHKRCFDAAATGLIDALPQALRDWAESHEHWKSLLERLPADPTRVAARFAFGFNLFRVGPAAADATDPANCGLIESTGGLSGQLFAEIEAECRETLKKSYSGKDSVGQKALRPLMRVQRKLEALRYLDPRCQPIIDRIGVVLGRLPHQGPIKGADLSAVVGLLHILASAEEMKAHGAKVLLAQRQPAVSSDAEENGDGADDICTPPHSSLIDLPSPSATPNPGPRPSNGAAPPAARPSSQATWI
jgi:hypothetical protein